MRDENPSPKHGSTSEPDKKSPKSVSQADGTAAGDPKGETKAQPSSSDRQDPSTTGKAHAPLNSQTPEAREGAVNPSAPTAGTEGGRNDLSQQFASDGPPTMDSAGETGTQTGEGTLEVDEQNVSADRSARKDSGVEREFTGKDNADSDRKEENDIEGAA
jgi:hypothetical protein